MLGHDGANEAEGRCLSAVHRKDVRGNHKGGVHGPCRVLSGRNSGEVIAHLCVFMPNQAQQQAAPPCVIDWGGRGGEAGGE